ncbi:hypothetical protein NLJ89_g10903 [Agrocybe chaxingu]|uniref:F-box domain-containing protein n=1 Tax=Agrocybe chaxingu TaxID=84603 RepID=A0A9W8MNH4_9AGAR|nr:hypothetical protein NLJ89_g10903 [Agrocybe chaxingu]
MPPVSFCVPRAPASRRLSDEILWYLYTFVRSSDPDRGPVSVSQVSRSWRRAAFGSSFLWSKVTIRLYTVTQRHHPARARLARSKLRDLDMTIIALRNFTPDELKTLVDMHRHRIRTLAVDTHSWIVTELLWLQLNLRFPRLEFFEGKVSYDSKVTLRRVPNFLELAEDDDTGLALQSSLIPFVKPPTIRLRPEVNWSSWSPRNLTTLKLLTTGFDAPPLYLDVLAMLAGTKETLRHFEYDGPLPFLPDDPTFVYDDVQLTFPQLETLMIGYADDIVWLVLFFGAPALKSLTIRDIITCPASPQFREWGLIPRTLPNQIDSLFLAVTQFFPGVTHLGLYGVGRPSEAVVNSMFQALTNLESLVLYGCADVFATSFFSGHAVEADELATQDANPFLPKLKRLLTTLLPPKCAGPFVLQRVQGRLENLLISQAAFEGMRQERDGLLTLEQMAVNVTSIPNPVPGVCVPVREEGVLRSGRMRNLLIPRVLRLI